MKRFTILFMLLMLMTTTAFAATIRVTGYGIGPQNVSMKSSFYKTHARQAARLDALRQISESVNGIKVDGETNIKDMMVMNDTIRAQMIGNFKGAKQVGKAEFFDDGRCALTMEYQLPQISDGGQFIEVIGMGVGSPGAKNEGIYKMQAIKAARTDALRQMAEAIQGVEVSADTPIESLMNSDVVKTKISAVIKGMQQIGEPKFIAGGGCEIKMRCFLFSDTILKAVLPTANETSESFPQPKFPQVKK